MARKAHEASDASCRTAYWWTNLSTPEYYDAHARDFNRKPEYTFAQIVQRESDGKLVAHTDNYERPHTLLDGLDPPGEPMKYAPKFVSYIQIVTRLDSRGAHGSGILAHSHI